MTLHERTMRRIERLEQHAWVLVAKAARQKNPKPGPGGAVKGTPPTVLRAFEAFTKAAQLRAGLMLREAAKERERTIRMKREPEREVPRRRGHSAGGAW